LVFSLSVLSFIALLLMAQGVFFIFNKAILSVTWSTPVNIDITGGLSSGKSVQIKMESETKTHLFYSGNAGAATRYSVVDSGVTTTPEAVYDSNSGVGSRELGMVLNGSNVPYVFQSDSGNGLYYALRDGGVTGGCASSNWSCFTVTSTIAIGDLATAMQGTTLMVTGRNTSNGDLLYFSCDTSSCATTTDWTDETIFDSDANKTYHDMSVNSSSQPIVAYRDHPEGFVYYATRIGGGGGTGCSDNNWSCVKLDTCAAEYISLAVDSTGNMGVSYVSSTDSGTIRFAYEDSGNTGCDTGGTSTFTCEDVNTVSNASVNANIFFSSTVPAISYYNDESSGSDEFIVSYKESGSWTSNVVATVDSGSLYSSIDGFGTTVGFSYYSDTDNNDVFFTDAPFVFNTAPTLTAITPVQTSSSVVTVTTTIADVDLDVTSLILEYSLDNITWASSTLGVITSVEGGDGVTLFDGNIGDIDTDIDGSIDLTIEWNIETDIDDTDDATVFFRLIPNDGTENGTTVSSSAFAVDTKDPVAPVGLTVNTTSTTSVILNFGTGAVDTNFLEYIILYKQGSSGVTLSDTSFASSSDANLTAIDFNSVPTTTISGLSVNTQYAMNIWGFDSWMQNASGTEMSFYTLADTPNTPAAVTSNGEFTIDITLGADNGATTYLVHDSETNKYLIADSTWNSSSSSAWLTYAALGGGSATTTTALPPNSYHTIEVKAKNGDGVETAYSSSISLYTLASTAGTSTIGIPTVTTLPITIDPSANPAATTYAVYNSTDGNYLDSAGAPTSTAVYSTTSTLGSSFSATGLIANTAYQFTAVARNGDFVDSATSTANTAVYTLANRPSSASAVADSYSQITVSWTGDGTQYYVENTTAGTNSGWISDARYAFTSLTASTEYSFRVKARNGDSVETDWSSTISATTDNSGGAPPAVPPPPPPPPEPDPECVLDCPINPSGLILINNGDSHTNTRRVTLNFDTEFTDLYAVSESGDFTGISFEPIVSSIPFVINSAGDGEKVVYAKFRNSLGTYDARDSIVLDTISPEPPRIITFSPDLIFDGTTGRYVFDNPSGEPVELRTLGLSEASSLVSVVGTRARTGEQVVYPRVQSDSNGNWSFDFPDVLFPEVYSLTLIASDLATNQSIESIIVVDLSGSAVPESDPRPDPDPDPEEPLPDPDPDPRPDPDPTPAQPDGSGGDQPSGGNPSDSGTPSGGSTLPTGGSTPTAKPQEKTTSSKVTETTEKIVENIVKASEPILEVVKVVIDNPKLEAVNEKAIVPVVATVGVANIATSVVVGGFQLPQILALLRYLFTQPFLLLRLRKRKDWGVVYNSFTKRPIDLATIRIVDTLTNKVVSSQVTDSQGRYLLTANPGTYKLEITKPGYSGSSEYLKEHTEDSDYINLYHGEEISVEEPTALSYNIPLDPIDKKVTTVKLLRDHTVKTTQSAVALAGLIITVLSFAISPTAIIALFFFLHLLFYSVFYRFSHIKLPAAWGKVVEKISQKPIGKVVIRVFDSAYDKLVETGVTDRRGRYAILVGPSKYYATYDKNGFKEKKTGELDFSSEKTQGTGGILNISEDLEKDT